MAITNGNRRKNDRLGESYGKASYRLKKSVTLMLMQASGEAYCHRCRGPIVSEEDFVLEHTTDWEVAPDPAAAFFDMASMAVAHPRCVKANRKAVA